MARFGNNILDSVTAKCDTSDGESYLKQCLKLAFPQTVAPENRYLMMLDAYLDESGTHDGSDAVTVAGFLATKDRWLEFELEINRIT